MSSICVNISEFREVISKMNNAVEKSKINPKSGWLELEVVSSDRMTVKVANYDYYMESVIPIDCDDFDYSNRIHATVSAEQFVPLVSKFDGDVVTIGIIGNSLNLSTTDYEYNVALIKELGKIRTVDAIEFNPVRCISATMDGVDVSSIATSNAKGLLNSTYSKDIQQFIYVDEIGAATFTENIYINDFSSVETDAPIKMLLNSTQANLLKVFESFTSVKVRVESYASDDMYESQYKVEFSAEDDAKIRLVLIVQPMSMADKFPIAKLRQLASNVSETHAVINKKEFERALSRLMVFDKKFDITVMNYSKLVFGKSSVKLVSIKNHNHEIIKYKSFTNTSEHESIIRFADLQNQLKAIQSTDIDISYGDSPAIVINSESLKQLIPEIRVTERV